MIDRTAFVLGGAFPGGPCFLIIFKLGTQKDPPTGKPQTEARTHSAPNLPVRILVTSKTLKNQNLNIVWSPSIQADVGYWMMSMQLMSVHHHQLLIAQCEKRCNRTLALSQVGTPVVCIPSLLVRFRFSVKFSNQFDTWCISACISVAYACIHTWRGVCKQA